MTLAEECSGPERRLYPQRRQLPFIHDRLCHHDREPEGSRLTSRYGVQRLVWYEEHFDIRDAIQREKSLKRWPRQWTIELIEKTNPEWFGPSAERGGSV